MREFRVTSFFHCPLQPPSDFSFTSVLALQLDCPGKIYDPGAGPLLDNFTVHLNNRNHRAAVNARKEKEKERVGA